MTADIASSRARLLASAGAGLVVLALLAAACTSGHSVPRDPEVATDVEVVMQALDRYWTRRGRPAPSLEALVPGELPTAPLPIGCEDGPMTYSVDEGGWWLVCPASCSHSWRSRAPGDHGYWLINRF